MVLEAKSILRHNVRDPCVVRFIESLGEEPESCTPDDETHIMFKRSGVSLLTDNVGRVNTIFLYGENEEGFDPYMGLLPCNLDFSWTQSDVHDSLGPPGNRGRAESILEPGSFINWETYLSDTITFHISYRSEDGEDGEDSKIGMLTLMALEDTP